MTDKYSYLLSSLEDEGRHYCPHSEKYTGVDSLVAAIHNGYTPQPYVRRQTMWRGGSRPVHIYYFELRRDNEAFTMAVVKSPRVTQIIDKYELIVQGGEQTAETA